MKQISIVAIIILTGVSLFISGCSRELKSMDDERPRQPFQFDSIPVLSGGIDSTGTPAVETQGSVVEPESVDISDGSEGEPIETQTGKIEIEPEQEEESPKITNLMNGGRLALQAENFPLALEYFASVLEDDPQHTGALYNISLVYRLANEPEKAVEYALLAVESDPDRLFVHQGLGNAYEMAGETDLAIEAYEQELIRHPDVPSLASTAAILATMYREKELIEDAIDAAITAVTLDPGEPAYHVLLGDTYMTNFAYEQAVSSYEDGLELVPESTKILIKLGDAHWDAGNQSEAVEYYTAAIEIDSEVRDSIPSERLEFELSEGVVDEESEIEDPIL